MSDLMVDENAPKPDKPEGLEKILIAREGDGMPVFTAVLPVEDVKRIIAFARERRVF